jgi:hypothetical protein
VYGFTRFVEESGDWKPVEDASSLVGSPINCVVQKGKNDPEAVCESWNSTHITISDISDRSDTIPVKVYDRNGTEVISKMNQVQAGTLQKNLRLNRITVPLDSMNQKVHLGETSTIVFMNDSNEIIDSHVEQNNPNNNFDTADPLELQAHGSFAEYLLMRFESMGSVPAEATIDNATINFYVINNGLDNTNEGYLINVYHLYQNFTWEEDNITWNKRPDALKDEHNATPQFVYNVTYQRPNETTVNGIFWEVGVKRIYESERDNGNFSVYITGSDIFGSPNSGDEIEMYSSERGPADQRPYLKIEYSIPTACECPDSQSWEIDLSNNCVLTEACNLYPGNLTFTGVGTFNCSAELNMSHRGDVPVDGTMYIKSGCLERIKGD